jgi:hypothetical protein
LLGSAASLTLLVVISYAAPLAGSWTSHRDHAVERADRRQETEEPDANRPPKADPVLRRPVRSACRISFPWSDRASPSWDEKPGELGHALWRHSPFPLGRRAGMPRHERLRTALPPLWTGDGGVAHPAWMTRGNCCARHSAAVTAAQNSAKGSRSDSGSVTGQQAGNHHGDTTDDAGDN